MEVVLLGLAAGYTVGRPGVCGRRVETSALPVSLRSGVAIAGVSDRMANDGLLYDGWGAEGMEMLNSTSTLQDQAEDLGVNRYDAVLIVAARAKQNAFQSVDDQPGGYLGNSFGGNMGTGARRAKSKKSQVVSAIEDLIGEVDETGELPDIVIPNLPEEDELDEEELDEEALEAELQAAADAAAEGSGDVGAIAGVVVYQYILGLFESAPSLDWTATAIINFALAVAMLVSVAIPGWKVIRKDPMRTLREL